LCYILCRSYESGDIVRIVVLEVSGLGWAGLGWAWIGLDSLGWVGLGSPELSSY